MCGCKNKNKGKTVQKTTLPSGQKLTREQYLQKLREKLQQNTNPTS